MFLCILVLLHFSSGRYRRYGVPGSSESFQFAWALILFAQHVHWRSGVDCPFSLFWLFRRGCWHCPNFGRRAERIFLLPFELVDVFRQVPCFSAGASFLFQGFVLHSFFEFLSPRNSLLRFKLLHDSLRWTLSFHYFHVTHRALGELDGVIRSQFSNFPQNTLFLRAILGNTTQ